MPKLSFEQCEKLHDGDLASFGPEHSHFYDEKGNGILHHLFLNAVPGSPRRAHVEEAVSRLRVSPYTFNRRLESPIDLALRRLHTSQDSDSVEIAAFLLEQPIHISDEYLNLVLGYALQQYGGDGGDGQSRKKIAIGVAASILCGVDVHELSNRDDGKRQAKYRGHLLFFNGISREKHELQYFVIEDFLALRIRSMVEIFVRLYGGYISDSDLYDARPSRREDLVNELRKDIIRNMQTLFVLRYGKYAERLSDTIKDRIVSSLAMGVVRTIEILPEGHSFILSTEWSGAVGTREPGHAVYTQIRRHVTWQMMVHNLGTGKELHLEGHRGDYRHPYPLGNLTAAAWGKGEAGWRYLNELLANLFPPGPVNVMQKIVYDQAKNGRVKALTGREITDLDSKLFAASLDQGPIDNCVLANHNAARCSAFLAGTFEWVCNQESQLSVALGVGERLPSLSLQASTFDLLELPLQPRGRSVWHRRSREEHIKAMRDAPYFEQRLSSSFCAPYLKTPDQEDPCHGTKEWVKKPGKRILVGCSGSGKTTFLHYFSADLMSEAEIEQQVIFISLTELLKHAREDPILRGNNPKQQLTDFLYKTLLRDTLSVGEGDDISERLEDASHCFEGHRVFFMDEYDQVAAELKSGGETLFKQLFNFLKAQPNWMISCGPAYVNELSRGEDTTILKIMPFSDEQLEMQIEKHYMLRRGKSITTEQESLIGSLPRQKGSPLWNLMRKPMMLKIVLDVYSEYRAAFSIKTMTDLYRAFELRLIDKGLTEESILTLSKKAYDLKGHPDSRIVEEHYLLSHSSLRDYFAAKHVVRLLDNVSGDAYKETEDFIMKRVGSPEWEMIFIFTIGHLSQERSEDKLLRFFEWIERGTNAGIDSESAPKSLKFIKLLAKFANEIKEDVSEGSRGLRNTWIAEIDKRWDSLFQEERIELAKTLQECPILIASESLQKKLQDLIEILSNECKQLIQNIQSKNHARERFFLKWEVGKLGSAVCIIAILGVTAFVAYQTASLIKGVYGREASTASRPPGILPSVPQEAIDREIKSAYVKVGTGTGTVLLLANKRYLSPFLNEEGEDSKSLKRKIYQLADIISIANSEQRDKIIELIKKMSQLEGSFPSIAGRFLRQVLLPTERQAEIHRLCDEIKTAQNKPKKLDSSSPKNSWLGRLRYGIKNDPVVIEQSDRHPNDPKETEATHEQKGDGLHYEIIGYIRQLGCLLEGGHFDSVEVVYAKKLLEEIKGGDYSQNVRDYADQALKQMGEVVKSQHSDSGEAPTIGSGAMCVESGLPKPAGDQWYDDSMMNQLLQHYYPAGSAVIQLDALSLDARSLTTEAEIEAGLIQHRLLKHFPQEADDSRPFFLPLRISYNHWVGLYIDRTPENPLVYWLDPYGRPPLDKAALLLVLNNSGIFSVTLTEAHIHTQENRLQEDGINCGPWVIEILRFFLEKGALPKIGDIDIDARRNEHSQVLISNPAEAKLTEVPPSGAALSNGAEFLSDVPQDGNYFYRALLSEFQKRGLASGLYFQELRNLAVERLKADLLTGAFHLNEGVDKEEYLATLVVDGVYAEGPIIYGLAQVFNVNFKILVSGEGVADESSLKTEYIKSSAGSLDLIELVRRGERYSMPELSITRHPVGAVADDRGQYHTVRPTASRAPEAGGGYSEHKSTEPEPPVAAVDTRRDGMQSASFLEASRPAV